MVPEPLRLDLPREELAFTPGVIPALYQIVEDLVKPGHGKVLTMTPAYGFFLHACEYAPGFSHPAGRQRGHRCQGCPQNGTRCRRGRQSIWCTSSASSRPSARSRRRRSPEPLLAKCKASGIFSSSFRSVSLLYWSHTKKTHGGGSSLLCRKIVRRIPPCVMRSKAPPSPW